MSIGVLIRVEAKVRMAVARKKFLEPLVVQPLPGSQSAFAEYLKKQSAKWAKVIKAANLNID